MPYDRSERLRLCNSLSPRARRHLLAQLDAANAAVEDAEDARAKIMAEVWTKGISLGAIQGKTGVGYDAVRRTLRGQGLDVEQA